MMVMRTKRVITHKMPMELARLGLDEGAHFEILNVKKDHARAPEEWRELVIQLESMTLAVTGDLARQVVRGSRPDEHDVC